MGRLIAGSSLNGGFMKITYIHHSAFLAETEHACLLFDYFKGSLPKLPEGKRLYIFASHRHPDHFSKVVFDIAAEHGDTVLLLSSDIWRKRVPEELKGAAVFLKPDTVWEDDVLKAETFRSTDEGVAFWCTVDGHTLYHAGDLNHWYWDGEDPQWNENMTRNYRKEIGKMEGRHADAAFLPLDPRLGEYFYLGIDDFMKMADADWIFPMHFWGEFDVGARLKDLDCSRGYRERIAEISTEGQEFSI